MDQTYSKSIHVQMLIIQEMWKNLICSSINVILYYIVMYASIYSTKWNMQHLNNGFNKFKVYDSTHVKMLIFQKMWNFLLNPFKYNYKTLNCMCFQIF
jgi:hypothetical protein